jgi:ParB-like chromosome segregation protein Spo0J
MAGNTIAINHIDSIEDFLAIREQLNPVYITSKKHGQVLVPCMNTILVRTKLVIANAYNPNHVPTDRMELLAQSILDNGFCFPVVAIWDDDSRLFVIIDGFHRRLISGEEWLDFDYIPVAVLDHDMARRMAATIQFNRARGVHQVELMGDLVQALVEQGATDEEIAKHLGMEMEEVYRLKQITGIAELFKHQTYSKSWVMMEVDDSA